MTYRRKDKIAAYEAAMEMIKAHSTLLDLPFGAGLAAVFKMLRASTKLTGTRCRQVAGKALRDAPPRPPSGHPGGEHRGVHGGDRVSQNRFAEDANYWDTTVHPAKSQAEGGTQFTALRWSTGVPDPVQRKLLRW